jgi:putative heme transporter
VPGEAPIDERAGAGSGATPDPEPLVAARGDGVPPVPGKQSAPVPASEHEEMPRIHFTRRQVLLFALFVSSCLAFLYFVLPKILGLKDTWNRIQHGNWWWLGFAALLELCSFLGYVVLFRGVFVRGRSRIGLKASYQITMAGLAATRLFASAGAGGIVLTAWALRRSGMAPRTVAQRMIAFNVLLYAVFMFVLVLGGLGLYLGVLPGDAPFAITVLPAIFGAAVIAIFLAVALVPRDFDRLVGRRWTTHGRLGRLAARVAAAPAAAAGGIRTAVALVRTRDPQLLGAVAWWGFDIAVLWASFHAFGGAPTIPVIVMSYFIGQLGNVLPLPGGIGGVDGAMIGAFSAFDVSGSLAVVSVLSYRAFAFWLPTLPGAVAYLQLRRTVHHWQDAEPATYT